jgi:uncharacterized protein
MNHAAKPRKPARSAEPSARNKSPTKSRSARTKRTKPPAADAQSALAERPKSLPVYREAHATESKSKAHCTACGLCCSYVAIEIDAPKSVKQATQLLWYVYHEGVSLYVNDDDWMVQFDTTCVHLQPDYRCGIYATRPHICREFSEQDCEVNTGDDGHTFHTAAEFMEYLKATRPRIHGFLQKNFAPPPEAPRQRLAPFEYRFQAVLARRQALKV